MQAFFFSQGTLSTIVLRYLDRFAFYAQVVRFGCAQEVHNVAALVGGTAAQEAVKVITHQWVPMNNTFIYNGVAGTAQSYEF